MNLFVGCPVYKTPHPLYVSYMNKTRRRFGDRVEVRHITGESCLARARATLYAEYRKFTKPWDAFLQVDDDQSWDTDELAHLLELLRDHPVLGLPIAYKADPPHEFAGQATVRGLEGEAVAADGTLRVQYLGGGFILWRRDALEAMERAFPHLAFDTNPPGGPSEPSYGFWCERIYERELLSEDYSACQWARDAGFEIRAYTRSCAPHWVGEREVDWTDPEAVARARASWKAYVPTGFKPVEILSVEPPGARRAAA